MSAEAPSPPSPEGLPRSGAHISPETAAIIGQVAGLAAANAIAAQLMPTRSAQESIRGPIPSMSETVIDDINQHLHMIGNPEPPKPDKGRVRLQWVPDNSAPNNRGGRWMELSDLRTPDAPTPLDTQSPLELIPRIRRNNAIARHLKGEAHHIAEARMRLGYGTPGTSEYAKLAKEGTRTNLFGIPLLPVPDLFHRRRAMRQHRIAQKATAAISPEAAKIQRTYDIDPGFVWDTKQKATAEAEAHVRQARLDAAGHPLDENELRRRVEVSAVRRHVASRYGIKMEEFDTGIKDDGKKHKLMAFDRMYHMDDEELRRLADAQLTPKRTEPVTVARGAARAVKNHLNEIKGPIKGVPTRARQNFRHRVVEYNKRQARNRRGVV